jgi:C-terminal processing protease CtpA/Prc
VNGVSFDNDMTEAQAAMLHMAGPVGTIAHFVVQRGDDTLGFDVMRQDKTLVTARMLDDETVYLFLSAFTQNAPQKVSAALHDLLEQHPKALIWDLRDNRGGSGPRSDYRYFIDRGLRSADEGRPQQQFLARGDAVAAAIPVSCW